jgi:hypothetical protein
MHTDDKDSSSPGGAINRRTYRRSRLRESIGPDAVHSSNARAKTFEARQPTKDDVHCIQGNAVAAGELEMCERRSVFCQELNGDVGDHGEIGHVELAKVW